MKSKQLLLWVSFIFLLLARLFVFAKQGKEDSQFVFYVADMKQQTIKLYWKDGKGKTFGSIERLKTGVAQKNQTLLFAMNGGMYKPDHSPVGLYIENEKLVSPLDTTSGSGNFYLKPNGVFYITTGNKAAICETASFTNATKVKYATQSGPMLVLNGTIHPAFTKGSTNKTIRNGVGILPNGNVVFALSKEPVNFYDFAAYFKTLGCKNVLYLDGYVSRMYLPQKKWIQTDGDFGVMIGITKQQ